MDKPLDHFLLDFLKNPGTVDQATIAGSVASLHASGRLSNRERVIADDILRMMTKAIEVQVREQLSEHLKYSALVPHDVALALARDVETVSLPILSYSDVLTDDDLIAIVRGKSPARQAAIAGRRTVTGAVSEALVRDGDRNAVLTLVNNQGADIRDNSFGTVVDRFGRDADMGAALVRRPKLPVAAASRLVALVTDSLKQELMSRHKVSAETVQAAVKQGSESSILSLVEPIGHIDEVVDAVRRFHRENKLSPTLLIRALCMGQLDFFEIGLSIRAGQPIDATRRQMIDLKQFPTLYRRAGLPQGLMPTYLQILDLLGPEIEQAALLPSDVRRTTARLTDRSDFDARDLEQLLAALQSRAQVA